MKLKWLILFIFSISFSSLQAQTFISKAEIEYEVKTNIQKTIPNFFFGDMLKDQMPQFKTGYYKYTFANNKSIYKFDRWAEGKKLPTWFTASDEENIWYCDYNSDKIDIQKNIDGNNLNIEDSIQKMKWRITNENRLIAGFNCRKAVAVIFDSVYVFAFYTDEIMISGGPCSINGLPGMILGVTIPRLYTSWIATKVSVKSVDENIIKPASTKKNVDFKYLEGVVKDRTKDWYSADETENAEIKKQKSIFLWLALL